MRYLIARSASHRPTLQHRMIAGDTSHTACGLDVGKWSIAYQARKISEVFCLRCARIRG